MSVWKAPRLTTLERMSITPDAAEIIFDTDLNLPFFGDGVTAGGVGFGETGSAIWGSITGTLSDQADLQAELDSKSKVIFSDWIAGTTNNPVTTATSASTAIVLAQMTKTFTPASATNIIKVLFTGTFSSNSFDDRAANMGVFIDGASAPELGTKRGTRVFDSTLFPGTMSTYWQGSLSAVSHTITIKFWANAGQVSGRDTDRSLLVEEVEL